MDINYDKLGKVIEVYARPLWEAGDSAKWPWRPGGGEVYVQEKVLKNAAPHLSEEALRSQPKESVVNALKANYNLISQFELMHATTFIEEVHANELRDHMLALLYGPGELATRLRRFLEWAKVEPIPEKNMKRGINATVASYLLSMSNPREYPFCKPIAYNSAVTELLRKEAIKRDPIERILHCKEFYTKILDFLETNYGLKDGNLLDLNSMFYCFQIKDKDDGLSAWDRIKGRPPKVVQPPDNVLYDLLMDKHNVVLYGPPGTGKTREALLFGRLWSRTYGQATVAQITFHPSYSYEDFIEGFRPTPDGSGFELKAGIFKRICEKARKDKDHKYLVIIDEINRGDVARILGELITLVEGDKRGDNYSTILPYSGDEFYVPENLYILGTMNTADKSISLMDLAIRRRFLFYYFPPDPDALDEGRDFCDEVANVRLSRLLIGLNQKLMDVGIDRDRVLGHSFFLIPRENKDLLGVLRNRLRYEVIPLVEEYCYADRSLMARVLGDLVEPNGSVNLDVMEDDEKLSLTLRTLSEIE